MEHANHWRLGIEDREVNECGYAYSYRMNQPPWQTASDFHAAIAKATNSV